MQRKKPTEKNNPGLRPEVSMSLRRWTITYGDFGNKSTSNLLAGLQGSNPSLFNKAKSVNVERVHINRICSEGSLPAKENKNNSPAQTEGSDLIPSSPEPQKITKSY